MMPTPKMNASAACIPATSAPMAKNSAPSATALIVIQRTVRATSTWMGLASSFTV